MPEASSHARISPETGDAIGRPTGATDGAGHTVDPADAHRSSRPGGRDAVERAGAEIRPRRGVAAADAASACSGTSPADGAQPDSIASFAARALAHASRLTRLRHRASLSDIETPPSADRADANRAPAPRTGRAVGSVAKSGAAAAFSVCTALVLPPAVEPCPPVLPPSTQAQPTLLQPAPPAPAPPPSRARATPPRLPGAQPGRAPRRRRVRSRRRAARRSRSAASKSPCRHRRRPRRLRLRAVPPRPRRAACCPAARCSASASDSDRASHAAARPWRGDAHAAQGHRSLGERIPGVAAAAVAEADHLADAAGQADRRSGGRPLSLSSERRRDLQEPAATARRGRAALHADGARPLLRAERAFGRDRCRHADRAAHHGAGREGAARCAADRRHDADQRPAGARPGDVRRQQPAAHHAAAGAGGGGRQLLDRGLLAAAPLGLLPGERRHARARQAAARRGKGPAIRHPDLHHRRAAARHQPERRHLPPAGRDAGPHDRGAARAGHPARRRRSLHPPGHGPHRRHRDAAAAPGIGNDDPDRGRRLAGAGHGRGHHRPGANDRQRHAHAARPLCRLGPDRAPAPAAGRLHPGDHAALEPGADRHRARHLGPGRSLRGRPVHDHRDRLHARAGRDALPRCRPRRNGQSGEPQSRRIRRAEPDLDPCPPARRYARRARSSRCA